MRTDDFQTQNAPGYSNPSLIFRTGMRRLERTATESPGVARKRSFGGGIVTEKETFDRMRKVRMKL